MPSPFHLRVYNAGIDVGDNIRHAVTDEPPRLHVGGRLFQPAALLHGGFFQAQNGGGFLFGNQVNGDFFWTTDNVLAMGLFHLLTTLTRVYKKCPVDLLG